MKTFPTPLHNRVLRLLMLLSLALLSWQHLQANPLVGAYTINSGELTGGTNYASFSDFAADLNTFGVAGNVVVTVAAGSGPYVEQVTIETIANAGPDATLLIEGNGETLTAPTSSENRHVLRLSNVAYATINNLRVAWDPASTGGFYGVHLFGTANHVHVSNCVFDLTGTTSTLYGGIVASGSETSILTTGDFHDISFIGNTSMGGGYGVSVFGLVSDLASNIIIANNQFLDFHSNGVYLRETDGAIVRNNMFDKSTPNVVSCNAIQMAQNANINAQIFNNRIRVSQMMNGTVTFRGIYLFNGTGHRVYNNLIYGVNLVSGNVTGIEVRTGGTSPEVYFNTISIDSEESTTGNLYGFVEGLSNTNTILRNNLISIGQPGSGNRSALVLGATSVVGTALDSDHNLLYVPGGNVGQRGTFSPTFYPTLANWQSISGQDGNSLDLNPEFQSFLVPVPTNSDADNAGTPIGFVTTDIDGMARGVIPDVGAFEFGPCPPPDAPSDIEGPLALCEGVQGSFSVEAIPGLTYNWSLNGNASILSGQGTAEVTVQFESSAVELSVVAEDDCGTSPASMFVVEVNLLPEFEITPNDDPYCLDASPVALQESHQNLSLEYSGAGVEGSSFNPEIAGIGVHVIDYVYTDTLTGCDNSGNFTIEVVLCTGIAPDATALVLKVHPNPFQGELTIENPYPQEAVTIRLYNARGQACWFERSEGAVISLRTGALPAGMYWLQLRSEKGGVGMARVIAQ